MRRKDEKFAAEQIRSRYAEHGGTKLEELKKLDRKAKRPAEVFAYAFGCTGALVLGIGMCLAMKVIGDLMPLGIVIGCIGIVMVSLNYSFYKKILKKGKEKYRRQILALSDQLMNG